MVCTHNFIWWTAVRTQERQERLTQICVSISISVIHRLQKELQITSHDDWYTVNTQQITDKKGFTLLDKVSKVTKRKQMRQRRGRIYYCVVIFSLVLFKTCFNKRTLVSHGNLLHHHLLLPLVLVFLLLLFLIFLTLPGTLGNFIHVLILLPKKREFSLNMEGG